MTDDEKRQQRAMLLLEYEETRQHYEDLKLKANSIRQELEQWSELLSKASFLPADRRYIVEFTNLRGKLLQSAEARSVKVTLLEILGLADEMEQTHHKLSELATRKKQYGF